MAAYKNKQTVESVPVSEEQPREAGLTPATLWGESVAPSPPSVDSFDGDNTDDTDPAVDRLSTMFVAPESIMVSMIDSNADSSTRSSTASLRSSIYEHVEENGRTYHRFRAGKYMLPNDEQEQERLDLQHHLYTMTLRGLHLAPLGSGPKRVLDIATGTGLWATEFANQYPSAQVLGTDLSAIQPLCFEIDDAEDEWVFGEQFDYIHGRALLSCFKDPKYVFQQAYNSLSPSGYFEMQDLVFPFHFLGEPPTDAPLYKWFETIMEGAARLGRPWTNVPNYKRWFQEIGFEDVVEKKFYWPINPWAKGKYYKQISVYAQADLLSGLEGLSLKVMGSMGHSAEEVQESLVDVIKDIKDTTLHCYCLMTVVYGKKPGDSGEGTR